MPAGSLPGPALVRARRRLRSSPALRTARGNRFESVIGKEEPMDIAIQGAIWLGAGVTLVMMLSRRRRRRVLR